MRLKSSALLLLLGLIVPGDVSAQERTPLPPTPPAPEGTGWGLASVAFLSGCWEGGDSGGLVLEERYSPARGGVMMGSTRYLRDTELANFEFSRIVENGGGVVLVPYPGGTRSAVGFRLTEVGPGHARFENPSHDFPSRIDYTRGAPSGEGAGPPTLDVQVTGTGGQAFGYRMQEVDCAGAGAPTDLPDYRVFRGDGTPLSMEQALAEMAAADVVFLGENHDDEVAHRLQATILEGMQDAVGESRPVVLSMEMFESDVQGVVDEYRGGLITEDHFLRSSRPWPRYADHYRPMVEFARTSGLEVVAANPPRRYVNLVSREGPAALDQLSGGAKDILPPLPLSPPSDRYRAQWDSLMGAAGMGGTPGQPAGGAPRHGAPADGISNGLWAQTLWDAGMAWSVAEALERRNDALVVHVAGAFHVNRGTGIPEHLARYRPSTRMFTVVFSPVDAGTGFDAERHHGLGDLVILTNAPAAQGAGDR